VKSWRLFCGLLLACVMAFAAMAAAAPAPAKVEISVLLDPATFGNEYLNWLDETWIPVFEKENPDIDIKLTVLTGNRLDTVAVSVAGGMPYDIVTAPHTLPMIEGVGKGWYLPLDSYIAKWKDAAQVIPAVWSHTQWKGVTYAIPNHLPPRVMAYNKNLFAQAGLNPDKPPASWDEMLDMARRLTRIDADKLVRRGYFITTAHLPL